MANYIEITRQEFEDGLKEIKDNLRLHMTGDIIPVIERDVWEYVYQFGTANPFITLKIYSSVDRRTQRSREMGKDAIRCVVCYEKHEIFQGTRHTKRMTKWKLYLEEKISDLLIHLDDIPNCPKCGKVMIQKKSKHGIFWGCSDFPRCKGTKRA